MTLIWIGFAVLVAAVTVAWLKKTATGPQPIVRSSRERSAAPARTVRSANRLPPTFDEAQADAPAATPPPAAPLPPALADFRQLRADDVPEDRRRAYVETFRNIPRPPKLLDHLLSPDFVNAASSSQLVELIAGEPLIAARVLRTVNSPMFALRSEVASIGQAVTYLGLNTVRSLCLQYILIASFKADSAERKAMLDAAWTASAVASELAQQLSQRLDYEDRGALVSAVVLSFLGRLATTATLSRSKLAQITPRGLLSRTACEQRVLGLGASQIGRLLMADWGLPSRIVEDAAEVDSVLTTPAGAFDAEHGSRLALCYLCARLGERLAEGTLSELASFDANAADDAEFFHFRSYLSHPRTARLLGAVRSGDVATVAAQTLAAVRGSLA